METPLDSNQTISTQKMEVEQFIFTGMIGMLGISNVLINVKIFNGGLVFCIKKFDMGIERSNAI